MSNFQRGLCLNLKFVCVLMQKSAIQDFKGKKDKNELYKAFI